MKLPRVRFTVSRMMVAVAVVGLLCGGEICRRRQRTFLTRSNLHMAKEIYYSHRKQVSAAMASGLGSSSIMEFLPRPAAGRPPTDQDEVIRSNKQDSASSARAEAYQRDLKEKYRHAARYPWLPVSPDPPEPK